MLAISGNRCIYVITLDLQNAGKDSNNGMFHSFWSFIKVAYSVPNKYVGKLNLRFPIMPRYTQLFNILVLGLSKKGTNN